MLRQLAMTVVGTQLACCAVGPDYHRPAVDAPAAFRFSGPDAAATADGPWWEEFGDTALDELVHAALANNKDLRIAAARVDEFAARLAGARSSLLPQLGYSASANRARSVVSPPVPGLYSGTLISAESQANLTASWELDLWGRLRRENEAARADVLATQDARRGIILTLVASVARSYITLRVLDRQLEISQATLASRSEAVSFFSARRQAGYASDIEMAQARVLYEEAAAEIPLLQTAIAQEEDSLCILLGENPGAIRRDKTLEALTSPAAPGGLPSELLARRPDIMQAEHALIAANARVGVARAQYFPDISLTGALGVASPQLSGLFSTPARIWSYTGQLVGPLFSSGRLLAQTRVNSAQREQVLLQYQQAIQNAFREVADALVDMRNTRERSSAVRRQVEAAREYARLSQSSYTNGYTGYFQVLDAERILFSIELLNAQAQGERLLTLVMLYMVLGGHWLDS
jgi:multidrug efflux system outer membrane protein